MIPTEDEMVGDISGFVHSWMQKCRLPNRLRSQTLGCLRTSNREGRHFVKLSPPSWVSLQSDLDRECSQHEAILGDDKDKAKSWGAAANDVFAFVLKQVLVDSGSWSVKPGWGTSDLVAHAAQVCRSALPSWLRRGRGNHRASAFEAARMFVSVKSKCFANDGAHTCAKPGHSCMRRIIGFSGYPFRSPWKLIARAADCIQPKVSCGIGVNSLKQLGPAIFNSAEKVDDSEDGLCLRCGRILEGWNLATADVDQAFEACGGQDLHDSLDHMASKFLAQNWYVSVKKGREVVTHVGRFWSACFVSIHVSEVVHAIKVFAEEVLCSFGSVVLLVPFPTPQA